MGVAADSTAALVWERPQEAAQLVRTLLARGDRTDKEPSPVQQVAMLCIVLGREVSAELMKHFSDYEIEEITLAIASTKSVESMQAGEFLEEFRQHLLAGEWINQGGIEFARAMLERAVGPRKTQEIIGRVTSRVAQGFYLLNKVAPDQIAPFISHEHPQTIALILSQLEPAQAAGILSLLPGRIQADVAYRITTLDKVTPNVIKLIEESLESSLRDILGGNQEVGGPKVLADILNLTSSSVEKNVLEQMDAQVPEEAEKVRNLMFVFEDIARLTDREIQTLLRELDEKDLVMSLKAASEKLKERLLGNLSEQARQKVREEMEFIGPMRLSEVEEVQLRIVLKVRQLEKQGQITVARGGTNDQLI
jgi:flagellar motor switch protein FliG